MAGFDAGEVLVASGANIYVAPLGTALPEDLDTPAGDFVLLGYVRPDGIEFNFGRESKDIESMQSFDPLRTVITKVPKTVKFQLQQSGADQIELALGGGQWVATADPEIFRFEKPEDSEVDERVLVVDLIDGDEIWRYMYPRSLNKAGVQFTGKRDEEVAYEIEMSILTPTDNSDSYEILTNAEGVEVAS